MKIVFDARYVRTDFHDGISRYSTELGAALSRLAPVVFLVESREQLKYFPERAGEIVGIPAETVMEPFTALKLNKHRPDVVFSPLQVIGSFGRKYSLILTLQDLIYHTHHRPPTQLHWWTQILWFLYHLTYIPQRLTVNRADVLATISESTKQEILQHRLTDKPIVVLTNAPRDLRSAHPEAIVEPKETPPANILYMGSFMGYKNVETLIRGMEFLPGRTLHLLSRISPKRRIQLEEIIPYGATVKFHNGVSDEEYAQLLADDAILASASSAEGFGLPLIEALMLGTPLACSDISVFHEVAADGAVYFDEKNPRDFAKTIHTLDPLNERQRHVRAGQKHIERFTWDESARTLLNAMKTLVEERRSGKTK